MTAAAATRARRRRSTRTRAQRKAEYKAQATRIARRRAELVLLLASDLTCAGCGFKAQSAAELVVDHVHGKSWTASKLSSSQRVARYRREYAAGIPMRALCNECSDRDGAYRRHGKMWVAPLEAPSDDVPF